jgi:hypothetical protein
MRRVLIFVGFVMACDLAALRQQEVPPVRVAKISLPNPAYIGMPIWMEVESPTGYKIHYPSSTTPNDFWCNEVEVKQDGRLLQPHIGLPAAGRNGPACGWPAAVVTADSKLPIHLQYPLTEPGIYMVRFTRREYGRSAHLEIAEQSDWVPLQVRAAPSGLAEKWLTSELVMLHDTPNLRVAEVLPSLLASRDPRVLRVMIDTSYDADTLVAQYAANSLGLFDPEQVRIHLLPILQERGPSDALGWLFSSDGDFALPIAAEIAAASLLHLRSSEPAEVEGSVHALSILRDHHFQLLPETVAQIDDALQADVEFIISQRNEKAAWWTANFLGSTRPPAGRALLWNLIDAGMAKEQSLICITWFHDTSDLPRLTAIVNQYNSSDPNGSTQFSVVMDMQTQYGTVTRPYLRDILASSKQTWVRTAAAKGLVQMNDRAGWEFFVEVVRQRPLYREEMVRWLGDMFPAVRDADDAAIVNFLESKVATATAE